MAMAQTNISYYSADSDSSGVLYLTQDTSSSMNWGGQNAQAVKLAALFNPFFAKGLVDRDPDNKDVMTKKGMIYPDRIETSLGAITLFIHHSHGLRIGLTAFDDQFFNLYPATKRDDIILNMLPQIKQYIATHTKGTNFDGPIPGSNEPYTGALQGAVDVFNGEPEDTTHIWILVTDGDSAIDADRAAVLKAEFQRLKIHMFVFGVGSDWAEGAADVQPLTNFVKSIGGEIAPVEDVARFNAAVDHIDALVASTVHVHKDQHQQDGLLLLLSIAGFAFVIYLLLAALRRSTL
jgi:hypothetical protein